jgi:REP element-mobilizing transposase RayT
MSRLRRVELHSRFFFVTTNLRRGIQPFDDREFPMLANAIELVRSRTKLALCAYCFMPDHWHAIVLPEEGSSISDVMMRIKILAQRQISKARASHEGIWQSRFYDHNLRTRREFDETDDYIHQNPVRRKLVESATEWPWSSAGWYADRTGPIPIDQVRLPFNPGDRI